jgi:hypothetical protein
MENWRRVWRDGFSCVLSDAALAAIRDGLKKDDPALIQGSTSDPLPLMCNRDLPACGACLISYGLWIGDGMGTVEEVEHAFSLACFNADQLLKEPGGCRWFLNYWDDAPRREAFAEVLLEVERTINQRKAIAHV